MAASAGGKNSHAVSGCTSVGGREVRSQVGGVRLMRHRDMGEWKGRSHKGEGPMGPTTAIRPNSCPANCSNERRWPAQGGIYYTL